MKIAVAFRTDPDQRKYLVDELGGETELIFLNDLAEDKKMEVLSEVEIILSWNPEKEGITNSKNLGSNLKFIQLMSAGYDHVNPDDFPSNVKIAANQGAYAEPMAEHALAMILALSKRLPLYHQHLVKGEFNQLKSPTKSLRGSVLGIIGFGSIGKATARLAKPFGVKVMALNTSGKTDEEVDYIGTLNDMEHVLRNADSLLISCALNEQTEGLINRQALELMKPDAVLVNVARGPIVVEKDLYEHLKGHPNFYAGIDAWWIEPFKYGRFELHYPFFELPNIIGSPHNSAMVENSMIIGTEKAVANLRRFINNEAVRGLINR
ncbi:MAG TPA: 2-hydroxyacid dehydrogenase [Tenuifilaceae bacterium]|nr:2-hydroxyacid dehydrogenase [Tenuifilaceae bacterium]HPW27260.1 2-hydroxyacid dehydrogenase [Tenuifilaceae bacterium]